MRLLLVLPITVFVIEGRAYTDSQACNGLRLWLENFDRVTLACRAIDLREVQPATSPLDGIPGYDRLVLIPLPEAYTPHRFALALPRTIHVLRAAIRDADSLHFAIGGLWGDWASVACLLAGSRPFAVWTDRVEHRVTAFSAEKKTGVKRLYTSMTARLMKSYERHLIPRAALGLFHGADCFEEYAPYSRNPHLVHDVHMPATSSARRRDFTGQHRIAYAGRVHEEKGVFDWIEVMALLSSRIPDIKATWFGDGPALTEARTRVRALGLQQISFTGPIPHQDMISALSAHDVFVFCHKTPESPRCLVEALICGLPIVGYCSAYPRDLISENGGGLLTPRDDPKSLADTLHAFLQNRNHVADLAEAARLDGMRFSPEQMFRHRSDLMKQFATRSPVPSPGAA